MRDDKVTTATNLELRNLPFADESLRGALRGRVIGRGLRENTGRGGRSAEFHGERTPRRDRDCSFDGLSPLAATHTQDSQKGNLRLDDFAATE